MFLLSTYVLELCVYQLQVISGMTEKILVLGLFVKLHTGNLFCLDMDIWERKLSSLSVMCHVKNKAAQSIWHWSLHGLQETVNEN